MDMLRESDNADRETLLPESFMVAEVYPNPFNSTATISYNLSESGMAKIAILDLQGRTVETLVDNQQSAGSHLVTWTATNASTEVYFCRMEAGNAVKTLKLTMVK